MSRTPPNRLRILFVDGIALNRIIARAMLEHAGRTVDLAEDGATVLAGRTQTPLSAILTDRPDDARH
jgi:CheY-like chemotaxis protein